MSALLSPARYFFSCCWLKMKRKTEWKSPASWQTMLKAGRQIGWRDLWQTPGVWLTTGGEPLCFLLTSSATYLILFSSNVEKNRWWIQLNTIILRSVTPHCPNTHTHFSVAHTCWHKDQCRRTSYWEPTEKGGGEKKKKQKSLPCSARPSTISTRTYISNSPVAVWKINL